MYAEIGLSERRNVGTFIQTYYKGMFSEKAEMYNLNLSNGE